MLAAFRPTACRCLLIRVVAVILVVCLIADPSVAQLARPDVWRAATAQGGFTSQISNPKFSLGSPIFNEQALQEALISPLQEITGGTEAKTATVHAAPVKGAATQATYPLDPSSEHHAEEATWGRGPHWVIGAAPIHAYFKGRSTRVAIDVLKDISVIFQIPETQWQELRAAGWDEKNMARLIRGVIGIYQDDGKTLMSEGDLKRLAEKSRAKPLFLAIVDQSSHLWEDDLQGHRLFMNRLLLNWKISHTPEFADIADIHFAAGLCHELAHEAAGKTQEIESALEKADKIAVSMQLLDYGVAREVYRLATEGHFLTETFYPFAEPLAFVSHLVMNVANLLRLGRLGTAMHYLEVAAQKLDALHDEINPGEEHHADLVTLEQRIKTLATQIVEDTDLLGSADFLPIPSTKAQEWAGHITAHFGSFPIPLTGETGGGSIIHQFEEWGTVAVLETSGKEPLGPFAVGVVLIPKAEQTISYDGVPLVLTEEASGKQEKVHFSPYLYDDGSGFVANFIQLPAGRYRLSVPFEQPTTPTKNTSIQGITFLETMLAIAAAAGGIGGALTWLALHPAQITNFLEYLPTWRHLMMGLFALVPVAMVAGASDEKDTLGRLLLQKLWEEQHQAQQKSEPFGLPNQLRAIRKVLNLERQALAAAANVSEKDLEAWEAGRAVPDIEAMHRLHHVFASRISRPYLTTMVTRLAGILFPETAEEREEFDLFHGVMIDRAKGELKRRLFLEPDIKSPNRDPERYFTLAWQNLAKQITSGQISYRGESTFETYFTTALRFAIGQMFKRARKQTRKELSPSISASDDSEGNAAAERWLDLKKTSRRAAVHDESPTKTPDPFEKYLPLLPYLPPTELMTLLVRIPFNRDQKGFKSTMTAISGRSRSGQLYYHRFGQAINKLRLWKQDAAQRPASIQSPYEWGGIENPRAFLDFLQLYQDRPFIAAFLASPFGKELVESLQFRMENPDFRPSRIFRIPQWDRPLFLPLEPPRSDDAAGAARARAVCAVVIGLAAQAGVLDYLGMVREEFELDDGIPKKATPDQLEMLKMVNAVDRLIRDAKYWSLLPGKKMAYTVPFLNDWNQAVALSRNLNHQDILRTLNSWVFPDLDAFRPRRTRSTKPSGITFLETMLAIVAAGVGIGGALTWLALHGAGGSIGGFLHSHGSSLAFFAFTPIALVRQGLFGYLLDSFARAHQSGSADVAEVRPPAALLRRFNIDPELASPESIIQTLGPALDVRASVLHEQLVGWLLTCGPEELLEDWNFVDAALQRKQEPYARLATRLLEALSDPRVAAHYHQSLPQLPELSRRDLLRSAGGFSLFHLLPTGLRSRVIWSDPFFGAPTAADRRYIEFLSKYDGGNFKDVLKLPLHRWPTFIKSYESRRRGGFPVSDFVRNVFSLPNRVVGNAFLKRIAQQRPGLVQEISNALNSHRFASMLTEIRLAQTRIPDPAAPQLFGATERELNALVLHSVHREVTDLPNEILASRLQGFLLQSIGQASIPGNDVVTMAKAYNGFDWSGLTVSEAEKILSRFESVPASRLSELAVDYGNRILRNNILPLARRFTAGQYNRAVRSMPDAVRRELHVDFGLPHDPLPDLVRQITQPMETLLGLIHRAGERNGNPATIGRAGEPFTRLEDTAAVAIIKTLDLDDLAHLSRHQAAQIPDGGYAIHRIPAVSVDPSRVPVGRELLHSELWRNAAGFDLVYNADGRLIAIVPVFSPEEAGQYIEGAKYLDLSPYYFDLPQLGDPGAAEKWEALVAGMNHDREAITRYLLDSGMLRRVYPLDEGIDIYFYAEVEKTAGVMDLHAISPASSLPNPYRLFNRDAAHLHQAILVRFPTVFRPRMEGGDRLYHQAIYVGTALQGSAKDPLGLRPGDLLKVYGPGAGLDTWLGHLTTEEPLRIEGKNPFEVANTEYFAGRLGIPLVKDNAARKFLWNMPSLYPYPRFRQDVNPVVKRVSSWQDGIDVEDVLTTLCEIAATPVLNGLVWFSGKTEEGAIEFFQRARLTLHKAGQEMNGLVFVVGRPASVKARTQSGFSLLAPLFAMVAAGVGIGAAVFSAQAWFDHFWLIHPVIFSGGLGLIVFGLFKSLIDKHPSWQSHYTDRLSWRIWKNLREYLLSVVPLTLIAAFIEWLPGGYWKMPPEFVDSLGKGATLLLPEAHVSLTDQLHLMNLVHTSSTYTYLNIPGILLLPALVAGAWGLLRLGLQRDPWKSWWKDHDNRTLILVSAGIWDVIISEIWHGGVVDLLVGTDPGSNIIRYGTVSVSDLLMFAAGLSLLLSIGQDFIHTQGRFGKTSSSTPSQHTKSRPLQLAA